jgi:hypothetical protein
MKEMCCAAYGRRTGAPNNGAVWKCHLRPLIRFQIFGLPYKTVGSRQDNIYRASFAAVLSGVCDELLGLHTVYMLSEGDPSSDLSLAKENVSRRCHTYWGA